MNTMTHKGYTARIDYSDEDAAFVGHIAGIRDVVGFHGESVSELRSATDRLLPTTFWISVVSVVRRDSSSPLLVTSKNDGDRPSTWRNTAVRRSATTRSPSQDTR